MCIPLFLSHTQALEFIHTRMHRVHRDVKPGNILLSDTTSIHNTLTSNTAAVSSTPGFAPPPVVPSASLGSTMHVKLADFGIAVCATPASGLTADGVIETSYPQTTLLKSPTGTRRYMSPERLGLEGYSFNSDVW